jgi:tetratricopeptide (TPR) repeat protein
MTVFFAAKQICRACLVLFLLGGIVGRGQAQTPDFSLVKEHWFETRTAHFHIYSCGTPQAVFKLAGRLEQFCEAYAGLAGNQAIASPPIAVVAFPTHEILKPFLPLYNGEPANLAAFFKRGSDENLIVLSLPEAAGGGDNMSVIYHEYTHLLFRHNDRFWPMWLKEGMAECYSTFATSGSNISIASPIWHHVELLKRAQWMPLTELFAVTHDSPQYNESSRQGIFYAESWLLSQFLMAGDQPGYRSRFGQYTVLLRQGQDSEEAFTNALQTSLPVMQAQLQRYFNNQVFRPIQMKATGNLAAAINVVTHTMTPVETYFRLGDELLRIDRFDAAATFFDKAQNVAPASPLPYEGQGLLAMQQEKPTDALNSLTQALQHGSTSFLAYYIYARERYRLTADGGERYGTLPGDQAAEIRNDLNKSLELMPDFAPAHELLGFFEMVQGDQPEVAEKQLEWAILLEPENAANVFTLAQFQFRNHTPALARQTLEPLLKSNVEAQLRERAAELIRDNAR